MHIQWFPGHMAKTRRLLEENLKYVDVVIELLDARIPISSRNPEFDRIIKNKPRVIALNKSDLADETVSKKWDLWYKNRGYTSIFIDSVKGTGISRLKDELRSLIKEKTDREREKGRKFRSIKTMVVGIPNVGKSTFINTLAGKKSAITGDKPGVTRGKQWIRINREIELLDTPGILWPKFDDMNTALHLAYTGAIKDDVLDIIEVASNLMSTLKELYPKEVANRFKLDLSESKTGYELLSEAGIKRGCLISGGEVDLNRIASIVLDEFRGAKIGKMTLEHPEDVDTEVTNG